MEIGHTLRFDIQDRSMVFEARRLLHDRIAPFGWTEERVGRVDLVVTEMGTNLIKHGGGGVLLATHNSGGLDFVAVDDGPGIPDLARAIDDGYSESGTRGCGLGAVIRAADETDIWSRPGEGTAVWARFRVDGVGFPPSFGWEIGGLAVPLAGESRCGDGWGVRTSDEQAWLFLFDGLGHGADAASAAVEAVRLFLQAPLDHPAGILEWMNPRLRHTRGGVGSVVRLDGQHGRLDAAGVGNISLKLVRNGKLKVLVPVNGTLGGQVRSPRTESYDFPPGSLVVLHSDGVQDRWKYDEWADLLVKHPALVAAVLGERLKRNRDDWSVLACRMKGGASP